MNLCIHSAVNILQHFRINLHVKRIFFEVSRNLKKDTTKVIKNNKSNKKNGKKKKIWTHHDYNN